MYNSSDGIGGSNDVLDKVILEQIAKHFDIKNEFILQMQGKVVDGQYVNEKFKSATNKSILEALRKEDAESIALDMIWWLCQWDHSHWLDSFFEGQRRNVVNRLLQRTSLYHPLFGQGKVHSLALAKSNL